MSVATATLRTEYISQVVIHMEEYINSLGEEGQWDAQITGDIIIEGVFKVILLLVTTMFYLKDLCQACLNLRQGCLPWIRITRWQLCSQCRQWASLFLAFRLCNQGDGVMPDRRRRGAETTI